MSYNVVITVLTLTFKKLTAEKTFKMTLSRMLPVGHYR